MLELAESVTELGVVSELLEPLIVTSVVVVHSLVHEHAEVETDEKGCPRLNRNSLQAAAVVAPAMSEVRRRCDAHKRS